ncbi:hypothetical protein SLA2020_472430 [Shorea laevis]
MEFSQCFDCKKETEVIVDHRSGDTICSGCGLVLESYRIDDTSEWRTFADDSDSRDPNRVGSPTNPFLDGGGLSTCITSSRKDGSVTEVFRSQKYAHNGDRNLIRGFKIISDMAERLGLVAAIKDRANQIYKNVDEQKSCKGRNLNAVLAAALFIACREAKLSRTLKEIATVAEGVRTKDIHKAALCIREEIETETAAAAVPASELVRRFCSKISMNNNEIKAVQEAVQKSAELDIRRNPKSVLAAIIYMITELSDAKKPLQDIASATEVAECTIKKSFKDLSPYASRLIPSWYAGEEVIKNMSCP